MARFRKILCPIDFDQISPVAIASDLAREHNATLYLLHVLPPGLEAQLDKMETAARTKLERISHQKLKAGTRYELLVMTGNPTVELLQAAKRLGVDLIVMATHGRKGLGRLVLGSVAERVVREAQCPVLTVSRAPRAASLPTRAKRNRHGFQLLSGA